MQIILLLLGRGLISDRLNLTLSNKPPNLQGMTTTRKENIKQNIIKAITVSDDMEVLTQIQKILFPNYQLANDFISLAKEPMPTTLDIPKLAKTQQYSTRKLQKSLLHFDHSIFAGEDVEELIAMI